jgi:hypothetical protein
MEIFQIDVDGRLFLSPDIDDWQPVEEREIDVIFDLDGYSDSGVPYLADRILYVYFPFEDEGLPDLIRLHEVAKLGAGLIRSGHRVLSHCGMGHNRSALLAGVILTYLGMTGRDAVTLIREKRMGALYNRCFAEYLLELPCSTAVEPG